MTRGKLIAIEGADGAGKATQSQFLLKKLEKVGPVTQFDFPRYEDSIGGKLVGRFLAGEFGDFLAMPPYISALPYTIDRAETKDNLIEILEGDNVLCNRYTPSNLAHQAAHLDTKEERTKFISWLEELEYKGLGLPRPSLVIYLYVPVDVASELIEKKEARGYLEGSGAKKDQHEADLDYQERVANIFLEMASEREGWHTIFCVKDGELRSPEDIHAEVWNIVSSHITE